MSRLNCRIPVNLISCKALVLKARVYSFLEDRVRHSVKQGGTHALRVGAGRGRVTWGHFGSDVRPDISKFTPFIYLGSESWDPFIYIPFKITTDIHIYTSTLHRKASRKE